MKNKEQIIDKFHKVKELGFVKSNRANNTGIGKTFEDYIGVVENNLKEPDLFGFEIKSHRDDVKSYITLFTKSPSFPKGANAYLKDKYGLPYEDNHSLKSLHTSMFASRFNTYAGKYSFKLINDRKNKEVRIGIYDIETKEIIDSSVGYTYKALQDALYKKLNNLFYVSAKRQYKDGKEFFAFDKAEIYTQPSFDLFLDLIDAGVIMYDIRMGSYKSGKKYGKPHDHGSGFRILEPNLTFLFAYKEVVE